ncbi:hypothetical protein AK830_g12078 [Neonectria ditissima]|uniref:Firmicutes EssC N-terminal domain-containing protein n=1 Tax=Neonectria ditissima TaxID=78410 RepID=A0A0P7B166_9HYPO|nr:hypothetical protein AK830_g12078 [Neonectria ditissima]
MLRFAPWAMLATAPLAQARFDWLHARHNAEECCPCPAPGASQDFTKTVIVSGPAGTAHTVTVTEPVRAPSKETVTVEHVVTDPGKTIYVTRTEEHVVTKEITVMNSQPYMHPSAKTVTLTPGSPHPSAVEPNGNNVEVLTKTIAIGGDDEHVRHEVVTVTLGGGKKHVQTVTLEKSKGTDEVRTVTIGDSDEHIVTIGNSNKHTVTIGDSDKHVITKTIQEDGKYYTVTIGGSSEHTVAVGESGEYTVTIGDSDKHVVTRTIQEDGKYYTVTVGDGSKHTVTVGDSDKHVTTKTIQEGGKHYTVIVTPTPSVQTITLEGGKETTKIVEVPCTITVTAPPQIATVTQHVEEFNTVTTTVTDSHGQPDVEIIVINVDTGKSTCKKMESGHPCKNSYEYPGGPEGHVVTVTAGGSATTAKEGGYVVTLTDGSIATVTEEGFVTTVKEGGYIVTVTEGSGPAGTDCPSMAVSTSIQTVYNTVLVTVGPDGGAAPKPTGTATTAGVEQPMSRRSIRGREQRSPRSVRW